MRLIDADALKDSFEDDGHLSAYIEEYIDDAPTIYAKPVRHGRWIRMDDTFARWKCSECGAIESHSGWGYCHCGAKMDGGKENDYE